MIKKLQKNIENKRYDMPTKEFFKLLKQLLKIESMLGKHFVSFREWDYAATPRQDQIEEFCDKHNLSLTVSLDPEWDPSSKYHITWGIK
jgi:hypothetical protein